jgi:hypothetical protein
MAVEQVAAAVDIMTLATLSMETAEQAVAQTAAVPQALTMTTILRKALLAVAVGAQLVVAQFCLKVVLSQVEQVAAQSQ